MKGLDELKKAIQEEKKKQNDELAEYGWEMYGSYYSGFMSALSIVEGHIAEMEMLNRSYKCRNCTYLSDEPTTGSWHRCNCAEKPFRTKTSHLVYKWNHCCKYFEKRKGEAL